MTVDVFSDTLVVKGNLNIEQFAEEVSRLLQKAWGQDWGTFHLDEPVGDEAESTRLPVITYDYVNRIRSKSHPSLDPILFDTFKDVDNNQIVKLYRQWFDVELVFRIYHKKNRDALELMADFENFLFLYKGHMKNLGLSEIIFKEELKPEVKSRWNTPVVERSLVYSVRIERITEQRATTNKVIGTDVRAEYGLQPSYGGNEIMRHYEEMQRYPKK